MDNANAESEGEMDDGRRGAPAVTVCGLQPAVFALLVMGFVDAAGQQAFVRTCRGLWAMRAHLVTKLVATEGNREFSVRLNKCQQLWVHPFARVYGYESLRELKIKVACVGLVAARLPGSLRTLELNSGEENVFRQVGVPAMDADEWEQIADGFYPSLTNLCTLEPLLPPLPPGLVRLCLEGMIPRAIVLYALPAGLEELVLNLAACQFSLVPCVWPARLRSLTVGGAFAYTISSPDRPAKFPDALEILRVTSPAFMHPLNLRATRLKTLDLARASVFNAPLGGLLPDTLEVLVLGDAYNQPVDRLPAGLRSLTAGQNFSQPVDSLPAGLQKLGVLSAVFAHPVHSLPAGLKVLTVAGATFAGVAMDPATLPRTLEHMHVAAWLGCSLTLGPGLPPGLKSLHIAGASIAGSGPLHDGISIYVDADFRAARGFARMSPAIKQKIVFV